MGDLNSGVAGLTAEEREFRDDAALAALSGLLAGRDTGKTAPSPETYAVASYAVADAMLAARVATSGSGSNQ
jgi:lysozyme family protein